MYRVRFVYSPLPDELLPYRILSKYDIYRNILIHFTTNEITSLASEILLITTISPIMWRGNIYLSIKIKTLNPLLEIGYSLGESMGQVNRHHQ